jgi:hypothetical protein
MAAANGRTDLDLKKRTKNTALRLRHRSGLRWCGGRPTLITPPPIFATLQWLVWIGRGRICKGLKKKTVREERRQRENTKREKF